jgi:hypothetical protein
MHMTKPWEETWEWNGEDVRDPVARVAVLRGPTSDEVGKLAAAAPEMARLLLSLEWADGHWSVNHRGGGCLSCGSARDEGHREDCRLVAVLRKAGVRE